jgi:hypothetical protein
VGSFKSHDDDGEEVAEEFTPPWFSKDRLRAAQNATGIAYF